MYIPREIPLVFLVLSICTTCGTNEIVVQVAAKSPIMVAKFMSVVSRKATKIS
jgi:hypothetical protein